MAPPCSLKRWSSTTCASVSAEAALSIPETSSPPLWSCDRPLEKLRARKNPWPEKHRRLGHSSLARRTHCSGSRHPLHGRVMPPAARNAIPKDRAMDAIPIAQQVPGWALPRECLDGLVRGPRGGGATGHVDAQDAPAVMGQHYEHEQNVEEHGRHVVKKSTDTSEPTWLSRKLRQVCDGGFLRRGRYFETVASEISMAS